MAGNIRIGGTKASVGDDPTSEYHGTDFELLLESLNAKQSFSDLDDVSRAHVLGILQGMELMRTKKLENWDLRAPFLTLEN